MQHEGSAADLPAQDSFLDIVANIVGILILLVMVVGVRAAYVPSDPSPADVERQSASDPAESFGDMQARLEKALTELNKMERDLQKQVTQIGAIGQQSSLVDQQRIALNMHRSAIEQDLERRRSQLDKQRQQEYDVQKQIFDSQLKLEKLNQEHLSLAAVPEEVERVESVPTPLAKTVVGNEVHVRLKDGLMALIPWDQLQDELMAHAPANLWRLNHQSEAVETVGPIGGFRMRYRMQEQKYAVRTDSGGEQVMGSIRRIVGFELLPTSDKLGVPLEQALQPNSLFSQHIAALPRGKTTVTAWTYPDSFSEFRALKRALFEKGFATAGRPLPQHALIGASRHGAKSAAQ